MQIFSTTVKAQHDAHREAVIEIASGKYGEALQRIENVAQESSAMETRCEEGFYPELE